MGLGNGLLYIYISIIEVEKYNWRSLRNRLGDNDGDCGGVGLCRCLD